MTALRICKQLDSDTLPELKPFIGKTVEIIVLDEAPAEGPRTTPVPKREASWQDKTVEQLAAEQGVKPIKDVSQLMGGWPEEERKDGFEEWLNERRRTEIVPPLPEK